MQKITSINDRITLELLLARCERKLRELEYSGGDKRREKILNYRKYIIERRMFLKKKGK